MSETNIVVYTLEKRQEILWRYFENHGNVSECVRKLRMIFEIWEAQSAPYVRQLVKKWMKLASTSINQNVKSQKQCLYPIILLLCQKVCVKCHQPLFTSVLYNWTFRRHHWILHEELDMMPLKVQLFRIWSQFTIQWVFASLSGSAIDLQEMLIMAKKIIFSNEAYFDPGGHLNK